MILQTDNYGDLLTTDDLAKMLKTSNQVIRRFLVAGKLPGIKIGARWYVPRSELEKFLSDKLEVKNEEK